MTSIVCGNGEFPYEHIGQAVAHLWILESARACRPTLLGARHYSVGTEKRVEIRIASCVSRSYKFTLVVCADRSYYIACGSTPWYVRKAARDMLSQIGLLFTKDL